MYKKTALSFFSLFFLFLLIFYSPLSSLFIEQLVSAYVLQTTGHVLYYDSTQWNGSSLVFKNPRLGKEPICQAHSVEISYELQIQKPQVSLHITLDRPYWLVSEESPLDLNEEKISSFLKKEEGWLKVKPMIHVKDGLIAWTPQQKIGQPPFYFSLDFDSTTGGWLRAQLDPLSAVSDCLTIHLFSRQHQMFAEWTCHQLSCPSILSILQSLFPSLKTWDVPSGRLDGQLTAVFSSHERPYIEGQMDLYDWSFADSTSNFKGKFPHLNLTFAKYIEGMSQEEGKTAGLLKIVEAGHLKSNSHSAMGWAIENLTGSIHLNGYQKAHLDLRADGVCQNHLSNFCLQGDAAFFARQGLSLNMTLRCLSQENQPGCLLLRFYPLEGSKIRKAELKFNDLSHHDWRFFQAMVHHYEPFIETITFQNGTFNAHLEADLTQQGFGQVTFNDLQASQVAFKFEPWNFVFHFPLVLGQGQFNLSSSNIWDTVKANLDIHNGEIHFEGNSSHPTPVTHIETDLNIDQGTIDHSIVNLAWAGLKGHADVEWDSVQQLVTLNLEGKVSDLIDLLPEPLSKAYAQSFDHHHVQVSTVMTYDSGQPRLGGLIYLQDKGSGQKDTINFGCHFIENELLKNYFERGMGWFHIQQASLDKFVSPLLFPKKTIFLRGQGEFQGTFNSHFLDVHYLVDNPQLESSDFFIEAKSQEGPLAGYHHIDFDVQHHEGQLPIQHGFYLDKKTGLCCSEIHTTLYFDDKILHLTNLEGFCEGLYVAGEMDLDYSDPRPETFSISLNLPTFQGTVSQVQRILSYVNPNLPIIQLPLEGDIESEGSPAFFSFHFYPKQCDIDIQLNGSLENGFMAYQAHELALKDLYAQFSYNHRQKKLGFKDVQGFVLVGKTPLVEEYPLEGSYIIFSQLGKPQLLLDLGIADLMGCQLARFVGSLEQQLDDSIIGKLNPTLSHIGHAYLEKCLFVLKDWNTVDHFDLTAAFDLTSCMQGLKRFQKTGLLGMPPSLFIDLQRWDLKGEKFKLALNYEASKGFLSYHMHGKEFSIHPFSSQPFLLKGRKNSKTWWVDQLDIGPLSLAAEVQSKEEGWKINFLGARYGSSLLAGLHGSWNTNQKEVEAKVDLFEAELSLLEEWPALQSVIDSLSPQGRLQGIGTIRIALGDFQEPFNWKINLSTTLTSFTLNKYPLTLTSPFSLKYDSRKGLELEKVKGFLPQAGSIEIERMQYQFQQDKLVIEGIKLYTPFYRLREQLNSWEYHFPQLINRELKEKLANLRGAGELAANLSFKKQKEDFELTCLIKEGCYYFQDKDYEFHNFHLALNSKQINFMTRTQQNHCPFILKGHADWPHLNQGELTLIDQLDVHALLSPLHIAWSRSEGDLKVNSIKGSFSGLSLFLKRQSGAEVSGLQGEVLVDLNKSKLLLEDSIAQQVEALECGPLYRLGGLWWLETGQEKALIDSLHFQGYIKGYQTHLKGFPVEKLDGTLCYQPGRVEILDLTAYDPAFSLKASHLLLSKNPYNQEWSFFIPKLQIKNLRPSLLLDQEETKPGRAKALLIKRFEVEDLKGQVSQVETWTGQGCCHFVNPSRKNLTHPLLAIPAEIILRLGLDPQVLNPVTGTIYFNLQGNRFYLTKFKDVYSEGRGSKFHLAQSEAPSWMDMNGNLSIYIRMKHYNLIFKLTELFTVSIQGHFKKPKYSLQKQSKSLSSSKPSGIKMLKRH